VKAQFLEHVFGIGHAPQHSISDRKKESAILVESSEASGILAGLRIRFFRSAFSVFVFAFHGLFRLAGIGDTLGVAQGHS
jgi:hypothetical protein